MGCRHSRTRRYGYFLYRESKEIRRFGRCLFLLFGFNSFILNLFAFLLIAATFAAHESKEICVVVGYRLGWWMARNCASTLPHCPWASMCCASAATRPSSRRDSRRQTVHDRVQKREARECPNRIRGLLVFPAFSFTVCGGLRVGRRGSPCYSRDSRLRHNPRPPLSCRLWRR